MYSQRELIALAAGKAALRRRIALHRAQCAVAAARVAQPLERLDRTLALWKWIAPLAPLAAVPLGFLVKRVVFRRLKILRAIVCWSPLVFAAAGGIGSALKFRFGSARFSSRRR